MKWIDEQYLGNLGSYGKNDGIKAITAYVLIMMSAFFQGWLYTTDVSVAILNSTQILIPLILIVIFIGYLSISKEKKDTIGISLNNIKQSIILGIIGGIVLLFLQTFLLCKVNGSEISILLPVLNNWIVFIVAAFEEEIIFRGYIQTRLSGLIKKQWITGIINALFFLSIHYPVRWVAAGRVSIFDLSGVYIISLLALHYFCDGVYKKTNCIWGSVVLHIIYNAVGAMIALS